MVKTGDSGNNVKLVLCDRSKDEDTFLTAENLGFLISSRSQKHSTAPALFFVGAVAAEAAVGARARVAVAGAAPAGADQTRRW